MGRENGHQIIEDNLSGMNGGSVSPDGYEFTINSSGQVTGMERVFGTHTYNINLPSDATFAVNTASNTVTETIAGTHTTESLVFGVESGSTNVYQVAQQTTTINTPTTSFGNGFTSGFTFTIANNQVSAMQEVAGPSGNTHTFNIPLQPDAVYAVGTANTVSVSSVSGNSIETTQYVMPSGATLYAVGSQSTTIVESGSATTQLSVNSFDRAEFTISSSGSVTVEQRVSFNGTATTVTPGGDVAFQQLAAGYVEETVTHGLHSAYVLYYEGGTSGIYTEIAHGSGTTVDLVGIQGQVAQLAHISPALAALI